MLDVPSNPSVTKSLCNIKSAIKPGIADDMCIKQMLAIRNAVTFRDGADLDRLRAVPSQISQAARFSEAVVFYYANE